MAIPSQRLFSAAAVFASLAAAVSGAAQAQAAPAADPGHVFARQNLAAWCIVPFDAAGRGPEARAQMLSDLGIEKLAYDWRPGDVPTFEEEIRALKEHGIAFFAMWDEHDEMFKLWEQYGISPQVWKMYPKPPGETQEEKVRATADALMPLITRCQAMGSKLGLYNHGGWGGEPENLVAVCDYLREERGADNIGIVYNMHHGHEHIQNFRQHLERMKPYLLCINLNGMNKDAEPKILPLGQGQFEQQMMRDILESGYGGPIGILDHRPEVDAEESLRQNLRGMKQLLEELGESAGLKTYPQAY